MIDSIKNCFKLTMLSFVILQLMACVEPIGGNNHNSDLVVQELVLDGATDGIVDNSQNKQESNSSSAATTDEYSILYDDADGDGVDEIHFIQQSTKTVKQKSNSNDVYIDDNGFAYAKSTIDDNQITIKESKVHKPTSSTLFSTEKTEYINDYGNVMPIKK